MTPFFHCRLPCFSIFLLSLFFSFAFFCSPLVIISFFNLLADPIKVYVSVNPQSLSLSVFTPHSPHDKSGSASATTKLPFSLSLTTSLSYTAGNCSCGCISSCHNLLFSAHNNKITFNYAQLEAALHMSISLPPPTIRSLSLLLTPLSLSLSLSPAVCVHS